MRLSTRGKYGLFAMYYLARNDGKGPQSLQSIASMGVPKQYLEQLLGHLRRAGLVNSVRGAQGGYQIARPPNEITLLDVIDAMEGPIEMSECTADERLCKRSSECTVRRVWQQVTDAINQELERISLQTMLEIEGETFEL